MILDTTLRGCVRLVDMDSACRAAESSCEIASIGSCATNCVIKDKDPSCPSASYFISISVSWYQRNIIGLPILDQLFDLWVVLCLDLFVVTEIFLLALMLHVLETVTVESVFVHFSRNVVDDNVLGFMRPFICRWFPICFRMNTTILASSKADPTYEGAGGVPSPGSL